MCGKRIPAVRNGVFRIVINVFHSPDSYVFRFHSDISALPFLFCRFLLSIFFTVRIAYSCISRRHRHRSVEAVTACHGVVMWLLSDYGGRVEQGVWNDCKN